MPVAPITTRTTDTFDDRLHRQPLLDRDVSCAALIDVPRSSVGRRDVRDAKQARQHEQYERRGAGAGRDNGHDRKHNHDGAGFGTPDRAAAGRRIRGQASRARNRMSTRLSTAVYVDRNRVSSSAL